MSNGRCPWICNYLAFSSIFREKSGTQLLLRDTAALFRHTMRKRGYTCCPTTCHRRKAEATKKTVGIVTPYKTLNSTNRLETPRYAQTSRKTSFHPLRIENLSRTSTLNKKITTSNTSRHKNFRDQLNIPNIFVLLFYFAKNLMSGTSTYSLTKSSQ